MSIILHIFVTALESSHYEHKFLISHYGEFS